MRVGCPCDGELETFQKALLASGYKTTAAGLQDQEWARARCRMQDPFGNRLVFYRSLG